METFKIEIQELLCKTLEVKADTKEQAIDKVKDLYKNEEIVLSEADYLTTEIIEFSK